MNSPKPADMSRGFLRERRNEMANSQQCRSELHVLHELHSYKRWKTLARQQMKNGFSSLRKRCNSCSSPQLGRLLAHLARVAHAIDATKRMGCLTTLN